MRIEDLQALADFDGSGEVVLSTPLADYYDKTETDALIPSTEDTIAFAIALG